jgi:hypothetical protein
MFSMIQSYVMKSTSNFDGRIRHVLFGVAERVLHDPTPLDAGHGMFNAHADLCQLPIDSLFPLRERMALRLSFFRLAGSRYRWLIALKPCILVESDLGRKRDGLLVHDPFFMHGPRVGRAQIQHAPTRRVDHEHVLIGMGLLLPAYFPHFSLAFFLILACVA